VPHEDFFESTSIEFSIWEKGQERIIKQHQRFEEIPKELKIKFYKDIQKFHLNEKIEYFRNKQESKSTLKMHIRQNNIRKII